MSEHTPWTVVLKTGEPQTKLCICRMDQDRTVLAEIVNATPQEAVLLAAAPDMLEALEVIAYQPLGSPEAPASEVLAACERIARAAIAKAKGEA